MNIRNFWKQTSGVAAIEFAIIAPILIAFTFGIIELGRAFFFKQNLIAATDSAARLLYIDPKTSEADLWNAVYTELFLAKQQTENTKNASLDEPLMLEWSGRPNQDDPSTGTLRVTYKFETLLSQLIIKSDFEMTVEKEIWLRPATP
jgi:Flp pilus assembly protein TadG